MPDKDQTAPSIPGPTPGDTDDGARFVHDSDNGHDEEKAAPARRAGFFSRESLLGPVKKDHGDLALLAHSFATGMVDAASFSNWGVFVAMQTGNTVILGLSTATVPSNPHAWVTTLVSLASFLVGAFLTFRVSIYLTPLGVSSNRLYLSAILLIQALLIIIPAILVTVPGLVPHHPPGISTAADTSRVINNIKIVSLLPPLAFQSGMQIALSRLLGFNELPVNVLTSTYCDLMGDTALFGRSNIKRNRRVAAVVLLLAGAIASGWLQRSPAGIRGPLWVAGAVKLIVAIAAFCFMARGEAVVKKA